mgnify:CR=1 FL=1
MRSVSPYYARSSGNTFYFRSKIPCDLRDHFGGRKQFKISLKCSLNSRSEKIIKSLNRTLCEYQSTHMFLTFFLARINLRTFRVDFASAGHNQMLLCRNNGTFEELSAKGIPLGIMPDVNFQSCETHIEVGDRLFLYTDGVTEAEDLYMELYGKERLLTILSKYNDKSSIDTLNAIKSSLGQYTRGLESSDDITMISLRRES